MGDKADRIAELEAEVRRLNRTIGFMRARRTDSLYGDRRPNCDPRCDCRCARFIEDDTPPPPPDPYAVRNMDLSSLVLPTVREDPFRWPLLNLTLNTPSRPAVSTKIEWTLPRQLSTKGAAGPWGQGEANEPIRTDYNYQQIFRLPWHGPGNIGSTPGIKPKLQQFLDAVEFSLRAGHRRSWYSGDRPVQTMGSIPSLLGRWPTKDDEVVLRPLRDLVLIYHKHRGVRNPEYAYRYELLMETSVQAVASSR